MNHVMLVEDDEVIRYVYRKMKAWRSYDFHIAAEVSNGVRALEAFRQNPVDVIFTDIRMPLMNGIHLMKEVNKISPQTLFVLISSYNEFEYAREGLRLGAIDYIVKPMEEKQLEEVLIRVKQKLDTQKWDTDLSWIQPIFQKKEILEDCLIHRLCKYLEKHIHSALSMEEVAEAMGLNKDYMGKQIKLKTGMSFKNLYHQTKVEYAKPLIRSGQYKVYEISELLGYPNADSFTQQFKSTTNMTPMEYKKSVTSDF